ncbi:glycerophosphodiester phosphodiesterase family protein [Salinibacterium sp. SYSU T00001]|uniref:glycerophosphodiester phosphodiesterase n=1 Tax=Homoserinimonas sedimenticola TaxID=2986805 RepID=UPI0022362217|nr:glycerophosphodiester phosphodiesterase family protein [Salinibacterium sedimenticola]MCW4386725.1 glycerophosphodiester phosphodiesterase family protein [Salinibacterium sedimenticola]
MATTLLSPPARRGLTASAITVALVLVLILGPAAARSHAANMFGTLRAPGEAAFVAGHRGDRSQAPENTLPAIEHAFAGAMVFVEVDVRLSADGVPVLIHDSTVDRTTNGSGRVDELTVAQLKTLDAGSWYSADYAGVRIPTLAEFLVLLAESRTKAMIELKGTWAEEDAAVIGSLVEEHGVADRTVVASFEAETLQAMLATAPDLPRLVLARELPADPVAEVHLHHAIALVTNPDALDEAPETVDIMHEAGLGILLYTLNEEESWADALGMGVDGIITDTPSSLDGWLAATAPGT